MRYVVEKTDPYAVNPHLTDETRECESATEAGVRMEELCPMDYDDVRDTLWRGEGFIRYCDEEGGAEVTVSRLDPEPDGASIRLHLRVVGVDKAKMQLLAARMGLLPPWLGELAWPFPTWRVLARPFDWAFDGADVPAPAPAPVVQR